MKIDWTIVSSIVLALIILGILSAIAAGWGKQV